MRIDRTTKLLLALIAMGLFLNALVPLTQPAAVHAQGAATELRLAQISNDLRQVSSHLSQISGHLDQLSSDTRQISNGFCSNDKLC